MIYIQCKNCYQHFGMAKYSFDRLDIIDNLSPPRIIILIKCRPTETQYNLFFSFSKSQKFRKNCRNKWELYSKRDHISYSVYAISIKFINILNCTFIDASCSQWYRIAKQEVFNYFSVLTEYNINVYRLLLSADRSLNRKSELKWKYHSHGSWQNEFLCSSMLFFTFCLIISHCVLCHWEIQWLKILEQISAVFNTLKEIILKQVFLGYPSPRLFKSNNWLTLKLFYVNTIHSNYDLLLLDS